MKDTVYINEYYLDKWFKAEGEPNKQKFIEKIWDLDYGKVFIDPNPIRVKNKVLTLDEIKKYRNLHQIKPDELVTFIATKQREWGKKYPIEITTSEFDFIPKGVTVYRAGDTIFTIQIRKSVKLSL